MQTHTGISGQGEIIMSSTIRIEKICEYCDASFIAKTSVTKFCSHDCGSKAYKAKKRNAKIEVAESHVIQVKLDAMNLLQAKEYLNISEACKVFGVSRRTIYRMIDKGEIHAAKLGSRTILRREDFDSLFDLREKVEVPKEKVFESYTVDEIEEKFRIKYSRLNVILNKTNIPKRVFNGRLHVSKPHIELLQSSQRGYRWYLYMVYSPRSAIEVWFE